MPAYYTSLEEDDCKTYYLNTTDTSEYVSIGDDGDAVLNPNFKWNETTYRHVDAKAAEIYKGLYDTVMSDFSALLEMFNFEMIVYDETSYFPQAGSDLFYYPF